MANSKESGMIKAINGSIVHKICSGQVVLTLATAVKELVENSLDAGATIIEVKLKDHGSSLVEVADNGHGVRDCDFEGLTLKHHTSKLEDFSDLSGIATFGFRGEALSSLCALSKLTIVTCHKDSNIGTRLEYDSHGALVKTSPVSRQVGTTVSVQDLFFTLPVRHKEFLRNLRKEFGKMVHLLTAYCLVCNDKRITCVHHTDKGKKTVVLSTNGAGTVRDNITCLFGAKQVSSLKELIQKTPSESVLAEFYLSATALEGLKNFRLNGFVSSCAHGAGRSSADRQFFFINGRPCDLPKVAKVVNEVYHNFNRHQFPFVFLGVSLEKDAVDVNVTPDKRKIFMQHEKLLLAAVKASLLHVYDQQPSIIGASPHGIMKDNRNMGFISQLQSTSQSEENKSPSLSNLKRAFSCDEDLKDLAVHSFKSPRISEPDHSSEKVLLDDDLHNLSRTDNNENAVVVPANEDLCGLGNSSALNSSGALALIEDSTYKTGTPDSELPQTNKELYSCQKIVTDQMTDLLASQNNFKGPLTSCKSIAEQSQTSLSDSKNELFHSGINFSLTLPFSENKIKGINKKSKSVKSSPLADILKFCRTTPAKSVSAQINALQSTDKSFTEKQSSRSLNEFFSPKSNQDNLSFQNLDQDVQTATFNGDQLSDEASSKVPAGLPCESEQVAPFKVSAYSSYEHEQVISSETPVRSSDEPEQVAIDQLVERRKRVTHCPFSLDSLKKTLQNKEKTTSSNSHEFRRFRSKIVPNENGSAEDELRREISKEMFSQMEIIGQFNLGFIITRLQDDLFIIDQHATDEKYNYEMLQKDTVLKTQKLLMPQKLELTAVTESTLLDNINIFENNGFKFSINEDEKPGQRVSLVSVPVSQNWSFGKEDVDELIFMLTDNSERMCRPSRVNQMFASRACRKSVMIGTHLSLQDMKKLVLHMGEIEQPWNCPHGRPTLRHLFSLNILNVPAAKSEKHMVI